MHYRFILNEDKSVEFSKEYKKHLTKHASFIPSANIEDRCFGKLLEYEKYNSYLGRNEKKDMFKKYSYVPRDIDKLFLMTCYDVFLIKNYKECMSWFLLTFFLFIISVSVFCYFFFVVKDSEYTSVVGVSLAVLNFLSMKFTFNLDEGLVRLNEGEKRRLIYGNEDNNSLKLMSEHIKSKCENLLSKIPSELQTRKSISITNCIKRSIMEDEELIEKINTDVFNIDKVLENINVKEEKRIANHLSYEGRLSYSDKRKLKKLLGDTCCACGIKMSDIYGDIGKGYIELHHKIPYSEMAENDTRILTQSDFCVLCPNCHKMVHKLDDPDDIELLSSIVKSNKNI